MKKSILSVGAATMLLAMLATGCASSRDALAKEYERLAAIKPGPKIIFSGDKAINDLGALSYTSHVFALDLMKNYVNATENHREYLAFMSDMDYYVKEEKMSEKDAYEKIKAEVSAKDPAMWKQVEAGIAATNALGPVELLKKIAPVAVTAAKTSQSATQLKNSFKGFDQATMLKAKTCADIINETAITTECLAFLTLQFQRVVTMMTYKK